MREFQGTIRPAERKDYDQIEVIMQEVQGLHVNWRPDIYKNSDTVLPKDVFEDFMEKGEIFCAELDGQVVGVATCMLRHIQIPIMHERKVLYVDTMAVKEEFRGQGIGHAFFAVLQNMVEKNGYQGLELQVNARNEAAIKMYEDYGFRPKSINMELTVKK